MARPRRVGRRLGCRQGRVEVYFANCGRGLGCFCASAVGGRTFAWGGCCELSVCVWDWFCVADGWLFCWPDTPCAMAVADDAVIRTAKTRLRTITGTSLSFNAVCAPNAAYLSCAAPFANTLRCYTRSPTEFQLNPIILIPARMASTRLPGKPLADIAGLPMIVHVMHRAQEAGIGPVAVACAEVEIAEAVRAAGGTAVLTDASLPSGSDRVHAALGELDPQARHDVIVNVQGDTPTLDPAALRAVVGPLSDPSIDIATLSGPRSRPRRRRPIPPS